VEGFLSRLDPNIIMDQSIQLAKHAEFKTAPDPMVGSILVTSDGTVLSQGYYLQAGKPHAEVITLKHLFAIPENAILFIPLEPCSFQKTGQSCTDLMIKKKIKYVCIGCRKIN
jgi:diaminohydroxyphosphoribosylaminopyrimidine deaminase / 5-amino-6-(5-phosphoribosylamino)uracil reductase